jgi:hypothetical protein
VQHTHHRCWVAGQEQFYRDIMVTWTVAGEHMPQQVLLGTMSGRHITIVKIQCIRRDRRGTGRGGGGTYAGGGIDIAAQGHSDSAVVNSGSRSMATQHGLCMVSTAVVVRHNLLGWRRETVSMLVIEYNP